MNQRNILAGVAGAALSMLFPRYRYSHKRTRRVRERNDQLPAWQDE
jgi:hypothetical protein